MRYSIEDARKNKGLTQNELAELSGVSRTIISGLESGRIKNTTAGTLVKIASALKVNVEDIFFAKDV